MKRILFLIVLLNSLLVHADPITQASTIFNNLKGQFNSGEAIANNLQKPLTTGSTMTTLDGQDSFNAQFSCNAEAEYLRVETSADMQNNINASISIDTDLNGTKDYAHTLSSMSSVCRNGYVRCLPGQDFENCDHVELSYDGSGITHNVLTAKADRARLYGCECYSTDCGSNLATPQVLSSLSANIATTISTGFANYNPRFIASRVSTVANVTTYFGQDVTTCGAANTSGASTITNFANAKRNDDGNYLLSAGISAVSAAPPGSPADILQTQQNNAILPRFTTQTCNVSRNMSYSTQPGLFDEEFSSVQMFSQGRVYITCDYSLATGNVSCVTDGLNEVGQITNTINLSQMCNSQSTVTKLSEGWFAPPTAYGYQDTSVTVTHHQLPDCTNNLVGRVTVRDTKSNWGDTNAYLSRQLNFKVSKPTCILGEVINDGCQIIDQNNCTLWDENVDGTKTISNSFPTGLTAPASAVSVTNGNCFSIETRDWHFKSRTYQCNSNGIGFNPQVGHLQEPTISGNTANITIGGVPHTLKRPPVTQPACQETCEVQTSVLDLQTNIDGQHSDGRIDNTRLSKVFKACENSVCPLEAGEAVIQPCGCSNNFGKAATAMQMLRLAGKDFICTSGTSSSY